MRKTKKPNVVVVWCVECAAPLSIHDGRDICAKCSQARAALNQAPIAAKVIRELEAWMRVIASAFLGDEMVYLPGEASAVLARVNKMIEESNAK